MCNIMGMYTLNTLLTGGVIMKPETLLLIIKDILDEYIILEKCPIETAELSFGQEQALSLVIILKSGQRMRLSPTHET